MSELDMEIEAFGYATDLINVLDLDDNDKATWNMKSEGMGRFVDGLTALAALELDERGVLIRKMLLAQGPKSIQNIVDALACREMLLKCKSASALGSICMCSNAAETLMALHGEIILRGLLRMVQTKNRWAQGDACFVLGWIVRWSSDQVVHEVATYLSKICDILSSTFTTPKEKSMDQDRESNLRIYPLILLLHLCQRKHDIDIVVILDALDCLFGALIDLDSIDEGATITQLAVSVLVTATATNQPVNCPLILQRKMIPKLIKISRLSSTTPETVNQLREFMQIITSYR